MHKFKNIKNFFNAGEMLCSRFCPSSSQFPSPQVAAFTRDIIYVSDFGHT